VSKLGTSEQAYDQARDPGEEIHEEEAGGVTTNTEKIATFPDDSILQPPLMVSHDGSQYLVGVASFASQSTEASSRLFLGKLQGTEASPVTGNFAPQSLAPIGWSTF